MSKPLNIAIGYLVLCGFWYNKRENQKWNILYCFYSVFMAVYVIGTILISLAVDMYLVISDLNLLISHSYMFLTIFSHLIKYINLIMKKREIEQIIKDLDLELSGPLSGKTLGMIERCDKKAFILIAVYFFPTIVSIFSSLFLVENEGVLPQPGWYPYDVSQPYYYEITYFHQCSSLVLSATTHVIMDCIAVILISQLTCCTQILFYSLENIHDDIACDMVRARDGDGNVLTENQDVILNEKIKMCIIFHQKVLKMAKEIRKCFSIPIFLQLTSSTLILCMALYKIVMISKDIIRIICESSYVVIMLFQVIIYCHYGQLLCDESSKIIEAAYSCKWYSSSVKFRRTLLIMMSEMSKPIVIKVGGLVDLSLQTYVTIVKTSYSIFTVLLQVNK